MKIIIETSGENDERVRKSKLKNDIKTTIMSFGYSEKEVMVHMDVKRNENLINADELIAAFDEKGLFLPEVVEELIRSQVETTKLS